MDNDQEHSCPLRGLTLCDGQVVEDLVDAHACYCARLSQPSAEHGSAERSELLHARARLVARAAIVQPRVALRQKLAEARARAERF